MTREPVLLCQRSPCSRRRFSSCGFRDNGLGSDYGVPRYGADNDTHQEGHLHLVGEPPLRPQTITRLQRRPKNDRARQQNEKRAADARSTPNSSAAAIVIPRARRTGNQR